METELGVVYAEATSVIQSAWETMTGKEPETQLGRLQREHP
jgi:hypothetical protein